MAGFDIQVQFLGAVPNAPCQAGDVLSAHVNPWHNQLKLESRREICFFQ